MRHRPIKHYEGDCSLPDSILKALKDGNELRLYWRTGRKGLNWVCEINGEVAMEHESEVSLQDAIYRVGVIYMNYIENPQGENA